MELRLRVILRVHGWVGDVRRGAYLGDDRAEAGQSREINCCIRREIDQKRDWLFERSARKFVSNKP